MSNILVAMSGHVKPGAVSRSGLSFRWQGVLRYPATVLGAPPAALSTFRLSGPFTVTAVQPGVDELTYLAPPGVLLDDSDRAIQSFNIAFVEPP